LNSHRYLPDHEVRLLYVHPAGDREFDLPQRASDSGADVVAIPERLPIDPCAVWRLFREIRRFSPHVLHAHDYKTDVLAVLIGKALGIKVITTLHGFGLTTGRLRLYYRADRWALRRMEKVIAVSTDLVEHALAVGVPPQRVALMENGIDLTRYRRTLTLPEAKRLLNIEANEFVLGGIGRLVPEKAFDVLIQAVGQCARSRPVVLVLAGDGPERSRLESLAEAHNCRSCVRFLGHRTDVPLVLQACDSFVLSSRREASPNVVLEAMALETPVIATRVAGVPDMITHDETGVLIEPENAAAIAEAVDRLERDPAFRARLAANARKTCEARFCFESRMSKERRIYDELFGSVERT
jgi:glycosyltransferase involved in cell wall biosynthesis